ncbi:hypothetical protein LMG26788_02004 [Achromobacter pulmonis]|uniref:Uncharacterized protein n=1 Tax=Achromobacter pulmonis TaxID=1389932 RepID=A0A6S7CNQ3_9BURK|nr:hypothetical protein LMG26788_02004 [Achromobacter pulmonis]
MQSSGHAPEGASIGEFADQAAGIAAMVCATAAVSFLP